MTATSFVFSPHAASAAAGNLVLTRYGAPTHDENQSRRTAQGDATLLVTADSNPGTSSRFCVGAVAAVGAVLGLRSRRWRRRRCRWAVLRSSGKLQRSARGGDASEANELLDFGMGSDLVVGSPQGKTKTGVVLLNIGTPASTSVEDVRDYLDKFLSDDRVIEIEPAPLKWLVLQVLLATRPKASAENYKRIWDPVRGSPLLYHSEDFAEGLQRELGQSFEVRIGMQYSEPSVKTALRDLKEMGVDSVVLVPMFPHYASGTIGACLDIAYNEAAKMYCTPYLSVVPPFYNNSLFVEPLRAQISEVVGPRGSHVDHLLFSFHGLPEEQCTRTDDTGTCCLKSADCCSRLTRANRNCYRAQCFETARLLAYELGLPDDAWSIGFQSRLTLRGRIKWIEPYTDEVFVSLAERGVKKLAIVAPSFVADCVETLEELGITGREEFKAAGGEELIVVPCLNSATMWVRGMGRIINEHLGISNTEPQVSKQGVVMKTNATNRAIPNQG